MKADPELIFGLASVASKALIRLWLRDKSPLDDIALDVLDELKPQIGDPLLRRRTARKFEEIGDRVIQELLPLFETDSPAIEENEVEAVILCVTRTLDHLALSLEDIAGALFDPNRLAIALMQTENDEIRYFSAAGAALYSRAILRICQLIVPISSIFPEVKTLSIRMVFEQEAIISEKIDRLIQQSRRILDISEMRGKDDVLQFEKDYLLTVAERLDFLELFGIDASAGSSRQRLLTAYVPLFASTYLEDTAEDGERNARRVVRVDDAPVDRALASSTESILVGSAGSGKSTLLQWLAVKCATKTFVGDLARWNDKVPFFVRLRDYVDTGLPSISSFVAGLSPALSEMLPQGWAKSVFAAGRALVLIDGLDELPEKQRASAQMWLADLTSVYRTCHYVYTSRPHVLEDKAWRADDLDRRGVRIVQINPMTIEGILEFISSWHEAMKGSMLSHHQIEELPKLEMGLKRIVVRDEAFRSLAENPLFCAVLCELHRDRHRDLPRDRLELYEAYSTLLLHRLDKAREVSQSDYPKLKLRQKQHIISRLALVMLKNGKYDATYNVVEREIESILVDMHRRPKDSSGEAVRRLFMQRSSILRGVSEGRVEFAHKEIRDYFAAKAIAIERDVDILVTRALDEDWQHIAVLAAGLLTPDDGLRLISELLCCGDKRSKLRRTYHLHALACLAHMDFVSPGIEDRIRERIGQVVPPTIESEVSQMACAGPIVAPFLSRAYLRRAPRRLVAQSSAVLCVRTLARIGGDEALESMRSYNTDSREIVQDEIIRSWDSFDREQFAETVFGDRRRLVLENLESLTGVGVLTNLKRLTIKGVETPLDLKELTNLVALETLSIASERQVTDIEFVRGLKSLRAVRLRLPAVLDYSPLAELKNLKTVVIESLNPACDQDAFRPIRAISGIRFVSISA
jgi:hypothetical protein